MTTAPTQTLPGSTQPFESTLRVSIVDDEPLAREGLRLHLEAAGGVQVVGEYGDGPTAVAALLQQPPDVLFLDIQMPGMDGFELLEALGPERMPLVVFVTAFGHHAVHAFEVHALDYLLKPVAQRRLAEALVHVRHRFRQRRLARCAGELHGLFGGAVEPEPQTPPPGGYLTRLMVKSRARVAVVRVEDLRWIESSGDYVYLHTASGKHLLRQTLAGFERRLDPATFQRIHRSAIVNLDRLAELRPLDHGEYRAVLDDGTQLKLSRSYRSRLQGVLGGKL